MREGHSFWGVKVEVLFRGYSVAEMFEIRRDLQDLIRKWKIKANQDSIQGFLKEVQEFDIRAMPFRDQII